MSPRKLLVATGLVICVCSVFWIGYQMLQSGGNGEFYIDAKGIAHGSGKQQYFYESKQLMLEEEYVNGELRVSSWYLPKGSLLESTSWENGTGTGYYLREDGSVRIKQQYVNGIAHGETVYFGEDGSIERIVDYDNGTEIVGEGNGS